jgi:hypothetical protein
MAGLGDDDLEEEKVSKEPATPGSLEIELDDPDKPDDDDDADEPEPQQTQTPEQRLSSRERRQRRGQAHKELEERTRAAEERAQRLEAQISELRGYVAGAVKPPQESNPAEALQKELEQINEEQALVYRQAQQLGEKLTAEDYAKINKKANELELKKHRVMSRLVQAETQTRPGQAQEYIQQQVFQQQLNVRFPDLVNTHAGQWGMQRYQQLLLEGKPAGWDTLEQAAEDARKQYGMPSRRQAPPTQQEKSKLVGTSKGGNGAGVATDKPRTIRLSKDQLRMVQAWNPSLYAKDEKKAARQWWDQIGSKHA